MTYTQIETMDQFPRELMEHIISFIPYESMINVLLVSKYFKSCITVNTIITISSYYRRLKTPIRHTYRELRKNKTHKL